VILPQWHPPSTFMFPASGWLIEQDTIHPQAALPEAFVLCRCAACARPPAARA
jgi:hypothetical protein